MTFEQLSEQAEKLTDDLKEHCDAVHIVLSYYEEGLTHFVHIGHGNSMLRQKMLERAAQRLEQQATIFFDDNDEDDDIAPDSPMPTP